MRAAQTMARERVQAAQRTPVRRERRSVDSTASRVPQALAASQALQTREEQKLVVPAEAERSARSPFGRRSGMGR
jgi:hypothetical protein